jgi:hypothetical protein
MLKLPSLSHLQVLVLYFLDARGSLTSDELQNHLKSAGVKQTIAAFYQLIGRLKRAKVINQKYRVIKLRKQSFHVCEYSILRKGEKTLRKILAFYEELSKEILLEPCDPRE